MKILRHCMACTGKNLYKFIDFGPQPKPNIYLSLKDLQKSGEMTYRLDAYVCTDCGLVQLGQVVPSEELFSDTYAYRTPEAMRDNFREAAEETIAHYNCASPLKVLEIGSGRGVALQEYQKLGMNVLGVDPATVCAREANKEGVKTIVQPFTVSLARRLRKEYGSMDIITAANVLQHIPDIRGTFKGISMILDKNGVFTLEFPYLGDILRDLAFDTFYAEHYYYLSLHPIEHICRSVGLTIFDAKPLPNIHCGSMRIFIKHTENVRPVTPESQVLFDSEKQFLDTKLYDNFRKRLDDNMHQLQEHLYIAKMRKEKIVAHGASAKFVTLTNYGHISSDMIRYVADSTKAKQGKFTPGMGIPVVSEARMVADAPDVIVCGIRNFYQQSKWLYDKVKKKNPKCKVLIPIPEVTYE